MPGVPDHPPSRAVTTGAADTRPAGLGAGAYLYDLWYLAMPGGRLKPRRLVAMTLLGEPLVFGRDHAGGPPSRFAITALIGAFLSVTGPSTARRTAPSSTR